MKSSEAPCSVICGNISKFFFGFVTATLRRVGERGAGQRAGASVRLVRATRGWAVEGAKRFSHRPF